jgi:hypothetical protein
MRINPSHLEQVCAPSLDRQRFTSGDAWTVLFILGGLAALRSVQPFDTWNMTHWAFNYGHGFIKRGLIGEIFSRVVGPVTVANVFTASWLLMALLAGALVLLLIGPALRQPNRLGAWLFGLVAITHSATIPRLVWDLGRHDHFLFLILLACLAVLYRASPVWRILVIPPLCVIGLLIHEGFFVMFLPLIFAVWFYEEGWKLFWPKLAIVICICAITLFIQTFGTISNPQFYSFPSKGYISVYTGLGYNIQYVFFYFIRAKAPLLLLNHVLLALTLVPTFLLLWHLAEVSPGIKRHRWERKVLVTAALSPLSLYLVALDHFRWWGLGITNLFIVIAYLALREHAVRNLADRIERMWVTAVCVVGVSLIFGTFGDYIYSYPLFHGLWFIPGLDKPSLH